MSLANLDALARDLESQARYAEAESVRRRIACVPVSSEEIDNLARLGRAARDAEASGDWVRWAALLASCPATA